MMNTGPPWTTAPEARLEQAADSHSEVTIIGGGPAACWLALHLATGGVSVQMCIRESSLLAGHWTQSHHWVSPTAFPSSFTESELAPFFWTWDWKAGPCGLFGCLWLHRRPTCTTPRPLKCEPGGASATWQMERRGRREPIWVAFASPLEGGELSAARTALMAALIALGVQLRFNTWSLPSHQERWPSPSEARNQLQCELIVYAEGRQDGALPFLESFYARPWQWAYPWTNRSPTIASIRLSMWGTKKPFVAAAALGSCILKWEKPNRSVCGIHTPDTVGPPYSTSHSQPCLGDHVTAP